MRLMLRGGRVVDPGSGIDDLMDIWIENGIISRVEHSPCPAFQGGPTEPGDWERAGWDVMDVAGLVVTPGLIDMHVHLREPGEEYKETIASGTLAAACGGFTAVCCMANTRPVNDSSSVTRYILDRAEKEGKVRVHPVAALTVGLRGTELCEYADLKEAGAVAVSDDGKPLLNSGVMRRAMEYARGFQLPVISHCEDPTLSGRGVMNEGPVATRMGLEGIPNFAESVMVERDIALCALTGTPLHVAHVSTSESVRAIRAAKSRGIPVTAETAPHYFTLTDEAIGDYDTNAKMSPPLRSPADREALLEALADGTIDVIASDHAPHSILEKAVEFDDAANGIVGLETSVSLCLQLVRKGVLSLAQLVEKMHTYPARILRFHDLGIRPGAKADLTLIDEEKSHVVDASAFFSKGRNTPFDGWNLKGKAVLTLVAGRVAFDGR
ncbi:dihydroorotase [Thermodesulfobacteriota bacterium]